MQQWSDFKYVFFTYILQIDIMNISIYIALMWVPQNQFPISQHNFRKLRVFIRQQAITWANVDPYLSRHMVSLGHNELITSVWH